jgi:hypothetical protein
MRCVCWQTRLEGREGELFHGRDGDRISRNMADDRSQGLEDVVVERGRLRSLAVLKALCDHPNKNPVSDSLSSQSTNAIYQWARRLGAGGDDRAPCRAH